MKYLGVIVATVALLVSLFSIFGKEEKKVGYIVNQKLFESYNGYKDAITELDARNNKQVSFLDSLTVSFGQRTNTKEYSELVSYHQTKFDIQNKEYSEEISGKLWMQINEYIKGFAEEKGYEYIIGAVGDGNLMYGSPELEITEELAEYINQKYDGK